MSAVSGKAVTTIEGLHPAGQHPLQVAWRAHGVPHCGAIVNPKRVRSQMGGACIMGLSNAFGSEISFKDGRVVQNNFDTFQVVRMRGAPKLIRVHLIGGDYDAPLGGVGEPGVPPIAPALCNAIFMATGQRIRNLPIAGQLSA